MHEYHRHVAVAKYLVVGTACSYDNVKYIRLMPKFKALNFRTAHVNNNFAEQRKKCAMK